MTDIDRWIEDAVGRYLAAIEVPEAPEAIVEDEIVETVKLPGQAESEISRLQAKVGRQAGSQKIDQFLVEFEDIALLLHPQAPVETEKVVVAQNVEHDPFSLRLVSSE